MIQLTDKLAVTADSRCYMLGNINGNRASKREQACSKAPKLVRVSYYSTMAQVVRGAVSRALREGVADGSITELKQFMKQAELLTEEFSAKLQALEV